MLLLFEINLLETKNFLKKMHRTTLVDAYDPKCPIRNILSRFSDKWGMLVIYYLTLKSKTRFNELRKNMPDISARMLSATLSTLVTDGLVSREQHNTVPPTVEYSLTEIGKSLVPYLESLIEWAKENGDRIMAHRLNSDE